MKFIKAKELRIELVKSLIDIYNSYAKEVKTPTSSFELTQLRNEIFALIQYDEYNLKYLLEDMNKSIII